MSLSRIIDTTTRVFECNGTLVHARRIGGGAFCNAYREIDTSGKWLDSVYLFMSLDKYCPGKEILAQCESSPYLPPIERMENMGTRRTEYSVWCTVWSAPLTAQHKGAWKQYKLLDATWNRVAWGVAFSKYRFYDLGAAMLDILRYKVSTLLYTAIENLYSNASNYSDSMCFEFSPRNCGVSPNGILLLRDVLFDRDKV